LEDFKGGMFRVLVATDIATRGSGEGNIGRNYDLPRYHETWTAGPDA